MAACSMGCFLKLFASAIILAAAPLAALGQSPTYKLGRTPGAEELRSWGFSVSPSGKDLPPGSGSAEQGAPVYAQKCASCHGKTGTEGPATRLVENLRRWPLATTIWDSVNRSMPFNQGGSLAPDEVYAVTAFLLFRNRIILESDVLDAKSLPKIEMPARKEFFPPWQDLWNPGETRPSGDYP